MNQQEMLNLARLHIFEKYKNPTRAAAFFGFAPSYLHKKLAGGGPLPKKLLADMGYEEDPQKQPTIYTYKKIEG
jgi:hypothetical protein